MDSLSPGKSEGLDVGSRRSVARLIDLLNDSAPMVAMEAAAALGRLRNPMQCPSGEAQADDAVD
jgi:HEAT repeat protein